MIEIKFPVIVKEDLQFGPISLKDALIGAPYSCPPDPFHFFCAGPPLVVSRPDPRPPAQRLTYLVDLDPEADRPGDLGLVTGVVMLAGQGERFRAHYRAEYPDGLTAFVPVDSPTVRLTAFPDHMQPQVVRHEPPGSAVDLEGLDDQDPAERALAVMLEGLEDV